MGYHDSDQCLLHHTPLKLKGVTSKSVLGLPTCHVLFIVLEWWMGLCPSSHHGLGMTGTSISPCSYRPDPITPVYSPVMSWVPSDYFLIRLMT